MPPEGKKHLSHTQVKKVVGRVFKWIIAKYGKVNGDMLFYTKVGNYLNDKLACLPSRGKTDGAERSWALILKRRFENGRRASADSIYKVCPPASPLIDCTHLDYVRHLTRESPMGGALVQRVGLSDGGVAAPRLSPAPSRLPAASLTSLPRSLHTCHRW